MDFWFSESMPKLDSAFEKISRPPEVISAYQQGLDCPVHNYAKVLHIACFL
jgi:hypothetical protein